MLGVTGQVLGAPFPKVPQPTCHSLMRYPAGLESLLKIYTERHRIYYRNENKTGDKRDLISLTKHIITYKSWDALKLLNT